MKKSPRRGGKRNGLSLNHIQKHLPWTLPYTTAFQASNNGEGHRFLMHDIMHVQKSLGKIAAMAERIDHGKPESGLALADNVADLVICALHIANTNPFGRFDLGAIVVKKLEDRNRVKLPPERVRVAVRGVGK